MRIIVLACRCAVSIKMKTDASRMGCLMPTIHSAQPTDREAWKDDSHSSVMGVEITDMVRSMCSVTASKEMRRIETEKRCDFVSVRLDNWIH